MTKTELKEIAHRWIDNLTSDEKFLTAVEAYSSASNNGKPVVSGLLPCTHTFKTTYIGVGYVAQCTKCGFVRQ